jgi:hypothetical protein
LKEEVKAMGGGVHAGERDGEGKVREIER